MADDKDLKAVLKQLTKAAEKKSKAGKKAPGYSRGGGEEEDHCQVQQPCSGQESRVVEEEESWR